MRNLTSHACVCIKGHGWNYYTILYKNTTAAAAAAIYTCKPSAGKNNYNYIICTSARAYEKAK